MKNMEKNRLAKLYAENERRSDFREFYLKRVLRNHLFLKYIHREPVLWYYAHRKTMKCDEANEYITSLINGDSPFMVSRFGYTECMVISQVMRSRLYDYAKESNELFNKWFSLLYTGAGFFPYDSNLADRYTDLMIDNTINEVDLLGTWYIPMEEFWVNEYMKSYYNTYITKDNIGKTNSWEYYFRQPCGYGMSDIAHSRNIIISSIDAADKNPNPIDISEFAKWQEYAHKNLALADTVQKEIDKKKNELWGDKRILGVLCRGTDYISTKPVGHPVQPDISDVMDKASDVMKKENCDAVYLATEDEMIFEKFRERFGDKLIAVSATRYKDTGDSNINEMSDRIIEASTDPAREKYNKGMDYAVTIGLLSRCNCLVAGQVSGTTGALLLTKGYDYVYLFDLGLYGDRG